MATTNEAYEDFLKECGTFIAQLGELAFLEDFDLPNNFFFILANGVEGELAVGSESHFKHIHLGPYKILLDKKGLLNGIIFSGEEPTLDERIETLRRLIYWFWHDLSHLIAALGRGQLWWAYGQIETLCRTCLNLMRLREDFMAEVTEYEKIEKVIPVEQLAPLLNTFCPMEQEPMREAAHSLVRFYQEIAPPLAQAHGIPYPETLAHLMITRLENLP